MNGINDYACSGNIASDILFSETKSGDAACSFKLAVEQIYKPTVFIRINVYGVNVGVVKGRNARRGDYIVVSGELMCRKGQSENTLIEVRCKDIVILSKDQRKGEKNGNAKEQR